MRTMARNAVVLILTLLLLSGSFASASASSSPAKIVNGFFSNAISMLMKWVKSLKATTKTAISGRPMMKFESGYIVETVFDGSKLGIEPYSVEVLPSGELLILDSANSNLYRISSSLSLFVFLFCGDDDEPYDKSGSRSPPSSAPRRDEETSELRDLTKSKVECADFLEKLESGQASVPQNIAGSNC